MVHPKRGEVWLVDLGLAAKVRPCLVLSIPFEDEDRSLVTAIAHTTSPRSSRFEVTVIEPAGSGRLSRLLDFFTRESMASASSMM